uniref:Retrotransposon gag domain-containing protein n=1 Tax=Tanacetum cinerariifolium TaxID=118510 RepID=A0A699HM02_TANCI|nr:hypothetical protein [Tanacetum cinerariifolium]
MSTRSSARNLFPPLDNPERTIRRRPRVNHTLLNDFEMATDGNGDPRVLDLRTMEELYQPTLNGRGGPIAIQATNFGLKNDMIQQVYNSCQFHGLPGDDANKHLDKFLHVTQSIKVNGVTNDALGLYLFSHSLTHHANALFDRLLRNSITTFEKLAKMLLGKYFPPSIVTKLKNENTNFCQRPDESLFEAWECYKLLIDHCPNHNILPVTEIDTFYNGLTLRHRDTITATAGGTFMKRRPEECYDLIKNMTAHHNDWDTFVQRSESSSSITSSNPEIIALKTEMAEINKNLMKVLQINQQVKALTHNCETCGGPNSYNDCPDTVGQTQNVYAAGAYNQGGNSYQPQSNRNLLSYHSNNYLRPPGFNQNPNRSNPNQNYQNQDRNQGDNHGIPQGNNQGRNQLFQAASHLMTSIEFINYMKANDAILKNMQTNMTSITNYNLELKNMFGHFIMMNTTSSSGSGTLLSNTITNPKADFKGITTRSGNAYKGPTILTTFSLPKIMERKIEVTKDMVPPTNNGSTKDVQPPVSKLKLQCQILSPFLVPLLSTLKLPLVLRSLTRNHLDFNISFADALILMPKFSSTIKSLLTNKEKLFELARTPLGEHFSTVLLKKLPENLGDPGKFLIPCDFPGMDECLALADLDASINLMPLSVRNKLSLPELYPMCMTLELTDRLISCPVGVAKDVFVKTGRALIDVYEGELTICVGNKAITFNLDQTSRYSADYDAMSVNRIYLIDRACEEYSQEVLGFFVSGNPTLTTKPTVFNSSC